ncbi:IS3 family transposase [Streptomyces sp. NBC_01264]|uniref:IS3 family transposase n=1 Tax=Streptomyces sp. NBC_01264 TaxID=2903804 RepID=UPI002259BE47|nr:IS3 family transposase [Streptomyces sp. NBC_01264]MCX4784333.1 IS3 family transposase [Streptomyces sp. NBC_01264]
MKPPARQPTTRSPTRSPCSTLPPARPTASRGFTPGLRRLGRKANRKRVARIMRQAGIQGVTRRKRRSLTRADKKARPAPDLIGRDFHAEIPGTKLVGDITYLPTAEGCLYLACWLDLATREIVGYAMADHEGPSRVKPQAGQGVLGCVAGPLPDRGVGTGAGQRSKHRDEAVKPTPPSAWIRQAGQPRRRAGKLTQFTRGRLEQTGDVRLTTHRSSGDRVTWSVPLIIGASMHAQMPY